MFITDATITLAPDTKIQVHFTGDGWVLISFRDAVPETHFRVWMTEDQFMVLTKK